MAKYKELLFFLLIYFGIRIFSFYFLPGTITNTLITASIVAGTCFLLVKNKSLGWLIITAEFFLGGSGSFLKLETTSLRSIFLIISLMIFFLQNFRDLFPPDKKSVLVGLITIIGAIGAVRGYWLGNNFSRIISDAAPYLFLLYYFPLRKLLSDNYYLKHTETILISAIIGSSFFILFTLAGFGTGWFVLQDSYYHWFRDIAGGKITFVEYNFFRLVLNEQLLLAPILIYYIFRLNQNFKKYLLIVISLLFLLAVNLTRIYFLAIFFGALILATFNNNIKFYKTILSTCLIFITIFISTFLIASGGKSLGLEIFGLRIQSIVAPRTEESSLSRLLLLPKILDKIKAHPVLGNGLGSTVSVYSPVLKQEIITPHYDWGYLEIIAELGIFGTIIWLLYIFNLIFKIKKQPSWLFASLSALLVINLTSPALFHVFGFIMLAYITAYSDRASIE